MVVLNQKFYYYKHIDFHRYSVILVVTATNTFFLLRRIDSVLELSTFKYVFSCKTLKVMRTLAVFLIRKELYRNKYPMTE